MPDDVAAARTAAEEQSAFSHPPVDPDVTAAYGDHPDQVIDFYLPRTTGGTGGTGGLAPLVVVLHGGAWRAPYDRRHLTPFADFLARRGFAVANVEYRRGELGTDGTSGGNAPVADDADATPVAGRWPDTFDDVAAALDALPALVREVLPTADPRRTVLTGHSAGG
ncbi:alpha/beta hydrolase, partial [Streptomyces acidiscabies]|uniref:alpha/beta hydrolase n=1 Tax=Streptomyces acidiscabies TaxID=42234 RepID=UPI000AA1F995